MKLDPEEQKAGMRWLGIAGIVAVALSAWLANADYRLSTSPREKDLHTTLTELRSAQTTTASRVTDERQLVTAASNPEAPADAAPAAEEGDGHESKDHAAH